MSSTPDLSRRTVAGLSIITAIALLLRLLYLGRKSFTGDESFTYALVRGDWHSLWEQISRYELNMVPYYVLMKAWIHVGTNEVAMRLPSAFIAVATVPLVCLLGRQLFSRRVAILASLLLAVNTGHIAYSQEARSYTLAVLLCTLAALFLLRAVGFSLDQEGRPGSTWDWIGFVFFGCLAVYTHFFCFFVIIAFALSLLIYPRLNQIWSRLLGSLVAIGILSIPVFWFALTRNGGRLDWVPPLTFSTFSKVPTLLAGSAAALVFYLAFWGKSVASGIRSTQAGSLSRWRYWFLLSWLVVPIAITVLLSLHKSVMVDRFLLICIPAAVLLAGDGLSQLPVRWQSGLLVLVVLISVGADIRLYRRRSLQDGRAASNYVLQNAACGDTVFFIPISGKGPFDFYRDQDRVSLSSCNGPALTIASVDQLTDLRSDHVWIVAMGPKQLPTDVTQQIDQMREKMNSEYALTSERRFEAFTVTEYGRKALPK